MTSATSYGDIAALQAATMSDSTSLSSSVDQCAALTDSDRADWYALAARALAFVSWTPTGGSGVGVDAIWSEGLAVRHLMSAWPAKLRAAGCNVQNLRQTPAAPPPPGPGFGAFVWNALEPALVLLALGVYVATRRK